MLPANSSAAVLMPLLLRATASLTTLATRGRSLLTSVELRAAVVATAGTLASYGSVLLLEHRAGLHVDVIVLAVAIGAMLGPTRRGDDQRDRLVSFAVLPLSAAAANEIATLMSRHPPAGDTLFALGVGAAVWLRRFGPRFAQSSTMVTVPLVAVLIAPVPPDAGVVHALWVAAAATITLAWITAVHWLAERLGCLPPARREAVGSVRPEGAMAERRGLSARLRPSTRMAVQMAASVGLAFALGRAIFPGHWNWSVLTGYIVCSGNRGRADVLYKGLLRVAGASVGTAAAAGVIGLFAPGDPLAVVAIFAVLFLATWLRPFSYAYWAGCITAALALLYGYFGETGFHLLRERLEAILLGAVLAIVASWLILPIKTTNVFRQRAATALAALSDILTALRSQQEELGRRQRRFATAVAGLEQIEPPLRAHRRLFARSRPCAQPVDVIDALRSCRLCTETITAIVVASPGSVGDLAPIMDDTSRLVAEARRTLAGRHTPDRSSQHFDDPQRPSPAVAPSDRLGLAMIELHSTAGQLSRFLSTAGLIRMR